ncbi:sphingomyelin phosphodiesterase 4-like isoform X2 [Lineus longissimus]|uniref:sphingomyelin phosphodiesterase 4-like isoform X2 n=1 Tax=Lineus longissimus TaxID=88925 RepID=UPI00315C5643
MLIEEASTKELHTIFPQLLEHIFGCVGQPGWGLHHIYKSSYSHGHDYNAVRNFLAPSGPIFKLVYKLQADDYLRYEFPISQLPTPTKNRMEDKVLSGMYARNSISFHAFEFYMFHFAFFLVNPLTLKSGPWVNPNEVVYLTILADYLDHFLPLGGREVPPMPAFASPVRSPIAHQTSLHRSTPGASTHPQVASPQRQYYSLLKSPSATNRAQSPHSPVSTDSKDNETWRSESFIQVMVEFWLNQNSVDSDHSKLSASSTDSFLPTIDHVRAVRMIIKHFHFFVNSGQQDVIVSPYQQLVLSPLDQLRRMLWPGLVQKKLYTFFKYGFSKWPLDSSFRMMLETWLSFLQPWRYTDPINSQDDFHESPDAREGLLDSKWAEFARENLLFYTNLLQEFLSRASRMDLGSAKNAYMLFRVAKVISMPKLAEVLLEAEASLFHSPMSPRKPGPMDLGGSYLSSSFSSASAVLSLQFAELEGPGFQYRPLFSEEMSARVEQLLAVLTQAKITAESSYRLSDNGSSSILKWLGFGPMIDYNAQRYSSYMGEDYTPTDSKKLFTHLDQSASRLCRFFRIEAWQTDNEGWAGQYGFGSSSTITTTKNLPPDHVVTDVGPQLTPLGRYQMVNGLRKFEIKYSGDVELNPVRSYESTILVRMLYDLSSFINKKMGHKFQEYYERDGLIGRAAHHVFLPPIQETYTPTGLKSTSPRLPQTKEQLDLACKPRLSLRFLASYNNLASFGLMYIAVRLILGLGPVGYLFFMCFIYLCYVLMRALCGT